MSGRLNKIADDAIERISDRNNGKGASGVDPTDPTDLADMAIWASTHIAAGIVDKANVFKEALSEWGEKVRPHLDQIYSRGLALHKSLTSPQELLRGADQMSSWHDWYDRHQAVIDRTFGDDADMFKQILSATSQAARVDSNVGLAVKAYRQMVSGEPFTGYMSGVIKNLDRVRANESLRGPKIGEFGKATTDTTAGSDDAIAVDRHIARLIFGKGQTNAAEKAMAKEVIRTIGAKYG